MSVKEIHVPHLGHSVKLGRKRPVAKGPHFKLSRYLNRSTLPSPPATGSYAAAAQNVIRQMYMNSTLGCCVCSFLGHAVGVITGNATNNPLIFTDQQIIALYSAIGGYNPNAPLVNGVNPTDNGCDEVTALNYWMSNGAPIGGTKILGYLAVNPRDPEEYTTALWLFENLMYGLELPDAWIQNPEPGFTWQPATPDPENGHCIGGVAWSPQGVTVMTWGFDGVITDSAMADVMAPQYGGELWVVLDPDQIASAQAKAPNGFDWEQLVADFDSLGGKIPLPNPNPNPKPSSTVTLSSSIILPAGTYSVAK